MTVSRTTIDFSVSTRAFSGKRSAVLMLLLAAFFWGSGNVANKTILQDLDPFAAAAARSLVAALALAPFAVRDLLRVSNKCLWAKSAVVPSALFSVALTVQQWGYQSASVTNASFLVNTACVLTPVIAFLFLRDKINFCTSLAAILTGVGIYLMSGAGRTLNELNVGDMACLVSAVFYAAWMVALSRHATAHGRPLATTCMHSALTLVFAGTACLLLAPQQPGTLGGAAIELLYLGIFSTALAFGLTAAAQARVSASTAAVLVAAESLFGAAGAMIYLGERPTHLAALGAGLMLFAIIIAARSAIVPTREPQSSHILTGGTTKP